MKISRAYIFFLLTFLICRITLYSGEPIDFPFSDRAMTGILIKDLKTGKVIAEHNSRKLMTPASTLKLVTVAAALTETGADSRYETRVSLYGTFSEKDSLFTGKVVITPSGDPTINNNKIEDTDNFTNYIADLLISKGIRHFKGEFIIEGDDVPQQGQLPTWEIEDASYGYGAGWYAFNYNDNTVRYNICTGATDPNAPFLTFDKTYSPSPFEITHGVDSDVYCLSGKIPSNPSRWLTVPLPWPATLFFEQIISALGEKNIRYECFKTDDCKDLPLVDSYVWTSCERKEIFDYLMTHSDNMMAEASLRSLAPGSTRDSSLVVERDILKGLGVDSKGMRIFDGSGLTRKNSVSPEFLADVLEAMHSTKNSSEYASYFPVAGKDGTMRSFRFKSSKGNILALKTGSVNGVRCYAGYLTDRTGKPLCAVVVMLNHLSCNVSDAKSAVEKYLQKTLGQY